MVIFAKSTDPHSNKTFTCEESFTAILIDKLNTTIFPSGMTRTNLYSVNYPNPLDIPLRDYALGPNVQYQLKNKKGDDIPQHWFYKVNETDITMDHPLPSGDIVFFHTDVVP